EGQFASKVSVARKVMRCGVPGEGAGRRNVELGSRGSKLADEGVRATRSVVACRARAPAAATLNSGAVVASSRTRASALHGPWWRAGRGRRRARGAARQ